MMKKREKIDLVILLLYPIFASIISLLYSFSFFSSIFLFLGFPSIYLSIRNPKYIKKALIFSIIAGGPLMVIIEYMGHLSKQWTFPPSIFPFKILDVVIVEVIFWVIFNLYFVIIFYEYFLDKHITKKIWHPHMKYLIVVILSFILPFSFLLSFKPDLLNIPYFYFYFGLILFLLPVILQVILKRSLFPKFLKTAAYFFYLSFLYEIMALKQGWWIFPSGTYIGWISLLGVQFPIEEFLHWILLFALATLVGYEFFEDDEK
jgi:hypothetical protein